MRSFCRLLENPDAGLVSAAIGGLQNLSGYRLIDREGVPGMFGFATLGESKPLLCVQLVRRGGSCHIPCEIPVSIAQQRVDEPANVALL